MNRLPAGLVALAGISATVLTSLGLRGSTIEGIELAAVAGGAACGAGVLGAIVLYAARRSSIAVQSALVAATSIGAVAAGAMAASHLMMASSSPIAALGVVLASAGTVGLLIALLLGERLRAGSEQLIAATRQIGEGDLRTRVVQPHAGELAAVARELEAMQSQLEASRAREREVEKARRELVAWISHDLRTPLARIRAIVEALEDKLIRDPDEVGEYYERLRVEAERLGRLINDLFELNRISAGTTELELERANAADIVSDIVASFAVIADARGISLRARRPQVDAVIAVSPTHLERALGNLLDNALRHTGRGGTVDVVLVSRAREVAVSIDDACGGTDVRLLKQLIAEVNAPRMLGRAGRTGLGIAIAKGLVEAQGGRIAVDATNRGCRFTVTLPRLRDGSVEPAPFTLSPWPGSERASSASTGTASRSRP